jgi:hypothetical protein
MATGNVYGHMKENNEALSDIPECPITKSGQEPNHGGFPPDNMARIPPKLL